MINLVIKSHVLVKNDSNARYFVRDGNSFICKGRTIRKVMGGVGEKKRIHARENAEKKIRAKKKIKKKNSCRRKARHLIAYWSVHTA